MSEESETRIEKHLDSIDTNIGKIFDRMSEQNERIAKVEGKQESFQNALDAQKNDVIRFEGDHTGPGGDHDRITNFHIAFITALISGAAIVLVVAGWLVMH